MNEAYFLNYTNAYRYGFNGQEKEPELGNGFTSAEFWMYDGRLGRRWNVDPVVKPWESGYACFGDAPTILFDPDGREATSEHYDHNGKKVATIIDGDNGKYKHGANADGGAVTRYQLEKRALTKGTSSGGEKFGIYTHDLYSSQSSKTNAIKVIERKTANLNMVSKNTIKAAINDAEKEFGNKNPDAVGVVMTEYSATFGGGMHTSTTFLKFNNGKDAGYVFAYQSTGGNVGLEAGILNPEYIYANYNKKERTNTYFSADGYKGQYNGISGGLGILSKSYTWSNIESQSEAYPGSRGIATWETYGSGLNLIPLPAFHDVGVKYYGGDTKILFKGLPLFKM